jgi:hypothetical protein
MLVSFRLETVLVDAGFALNIPQTQKSFCTHSMKVLGDMGKWNLVLVCLETVLVSVQDRCTVCTKCTMSSKTFWMPVMVLLGDKAKEEARFSPYEDSANLDAR